MTRLLLLLVLCLAVAAAPLAAPAQGVKRPSKRPTIAGLDTNSAAAYYQHGLAMLEKSPAIAAVSFEWALLLDPGWAEPYYARRIALHMTNQRQLADYVLGVPHVVRSDRVRQIDSLHYEALIRNPFLYQKLNKVMIEQHFYNQTGVSGALIDWDRQDPGLAGWLAYSRGDFPKALTYYTRAASKGRDGYEYQTNRARAFYGMAQYDSTVAALNLYLAEARKRDEKDLIYFYDSKALYEYSIGHALVQKGDLDGARAAYGRALTEDLSFYMAHAALARLASTAGDTATAFLEYGLAVELRPDDAAMRYQYGMALMQARRFDDAAAQFQKATEASPHYAAPYFPLAYILDGAKGDDAGALKNYEAFLARAPKSMTGEIAQATAQLADIRARMAAAKPPPPAKR